MELSGEEKKLQALFSELKTADEETAPQFARVWNRAALKPRRAFVFNPAFVAAIALRALRCRFIRRLVAIPAADITSCSCEGDALSGEHGQHTFD